MREHELKGDCFCHQKPKYYISECPETGRQFLVESGKDGNIIELTAVNIKKIRKIAIASWGFRGYKRVWKRTD
jgi:hypothetical protein